MKLLVTGGAGFIGTNFVYHMVSRGHKVRVLDKLTYAGGQDNFEPISNSVEFVVGDVCDLPIVAKCLAGVDWVVHFAAESHNTRSESNPEIFFRTNVEGTRILLDEALKCKVKRFIHISTDEVYGSITNGYFEEVDKVPGESQATSAYSKSKALADDLAVASFKQGLPVIVTRTTNNFGPWQFPEKALPRWITNLLLGKKIPLWGEGHQVRDWLYAPENAQAIEYILHQGVVGEVYNVAANQRPEITNQQAARWLCELLQKNPADWIEYLPDPRPNHDFRYALNTEKLAKLGWQSKVSIMSAFAETIAWYQNHESWWRSRKATAEAIYG